MYVTVGNKTLPSQGRAYPDGTEISFRSLFWEEVVSFSEYKDADKPIDLLKMLDANGVFKGISIWDVTIGDWQYLELSLIASSFSTPTYNISEKCPECKDNMVEPSEVKKDKSRDPNVFFEMPGFAKKNIPPKLSAKLTPVDFVFNTIDDDIYSSLVVTLGDGKDVTLDHYRLKHFKEVLEKELTSSVMNQIAVCTGLNLKKVTMEDGEMLVEARNMLDHGLVDEFVLKCNKCSHTKNVSLAWEVLEFIPFHRDRNSIRNRIRVRNTSKPADSPTPENGVYTGKSSIRPAS